MPETFNIYERYSLDDVHKVIGGDLKLLTVIVKEWSKRKRLGIKCYDGVWVIPGGEIPAIKNEMRERELE